MSLSGTNPIAFQDDLNIYPSLIPWSQHWVCPKRANQERTNNSKNDMTEVNSSEFATIQSS
jgi:hypothetical protein